MKSERQADKVARILEVDVGIRRGGCQVREVVARSVSQAGLPSRAHSTRRTMLLLDGIADLIPSWAESPTCSDG
jgi:hypothetical protein